MKAIAIIEVIFVLEVIADVEKSPSNSSLLQVQGSTLHAPALIPFEFDSSSGKLKLQAQKGRRSIKTSC